jgi:hypothetical protein
MLTKIGPEKEKFVRAVAARVQQHGLKFEEVLREREAKNEKFAFLRDVEVSMNKVPAGGMPRLTSFMTSVATRISPLPPLCRFEISAPDAAS